MLFFLLPPSEGKQLGGNHQRSSTLFTLPLPKHIATSVTEKDLKCSGTRYIQGIQLNTQIQTSPTLAAIERYSGTMFKALSYDTLLPSTKTFFNQHVLICSGMYGLLSPQDTIGNYKLPIGTKGLTNYRKKEGITSVIIDYAKKHNATLIDLLPGSYKKMFNRKLIHEAGIHSTEVNFYANDNGVLKKLTHAVKQVKGRWLHDICTQQIGYIQGLGGVQLEHEIQIIDYGKAE